MRCYARYLRFKSAIDSGPDSTLELDDRDFESGSLGLRGPHLPLLQDCHESNIIRQIVREPWRRRDNGVPVCVLPPGSHPHSVVTVVHVDALEFMVA